MHRRRRCMGRTLTVWLAGVCAFAVGAAVPAFAHGPDGEMTVITAEQTGPDRLTVEIGLLYANDNDLAEEATVTAALTGPDGVATPVPLPRIAGARYGTQVTVDTQGTWAVAVRSTNPAAEATATVEVGAVSTPSAAVSPRPTATQEPSAGGASPSRSTADELESAPWSVIAAAAGLLAVATAGVAVWKRRRRE